MKKKVTEMKLQLKRNFYKDLNLYFLLALIIWSFYDFIKYHSLADYIINGILLAIAISGLFSSLLTIRHQK